MVKPAGPGVYSATYSNIPVYEFQFGEGLKEHVMRRRADDWINATHILKAAGFDKPARTRILEREVQKDMHEKVQGGYGKYQGTWVPLEQGEALAQRNNVYEKLRTIFEFQPGNLSPPPAPKHTTAKPKVPKKPAVPKWSTMAAPARGMDDDYDGISQLNDDESMADDVTVASASFMAEDDRYDMSQQSTGHRKRKRDEEAHLALEQAHVLYADELLDFFMAHTNIKPEPPLNFNADWIIDQDGHTAMHWAAAMGDMSVIKELIKHGANLAAQNIRGETPLMRAVLFTNVLDKQAMHQICKELIGTVDMVDYCQATALHHIAAMCNSRAKLQCARYYLDVLLNKMQEVLDPEQFQAILDARDVQGNTAIHIAAKHGARKCVRALSGRGARVDIYNNEHITGENYIHIMHQNRAVDRHNNGSSSPYQPDFDSQRPEEPKTYSTAHVTEASMSIQSKMIPMMHEKFQDLAFSFDEEFSEKIVAEREASRILQNTLMELNTVDHARNMIEFNEDRREAAQDRDHVAKLEIELKSIVEQQQKLMLVGRIQHELTMSNGHTKDDIDERVVLAQALKTEQENRLAFMDQYCEARGWAGAGEKGAAYQRLIAKCIGAEVQNMDEETLSQLIDQLTEDQRGEAGETVYPEDL